MSVRLGVGGWGVWELLPPQWRLDSGQGDAPEAPGAPRCRHSPSAALLYSSWSKCKRAALAPLQLWQMTINGDSLMETLNRSYQAWACVFVFRDSTLKNCKEACTHAHTPVTCLAGVLKCVTMKMPPPRHSSFTVTTIRHGRGEK